MFLRLAAGLFVGIHLAGLFIASPSLADQITYVDENRDKVTVEARFYGSDRGTVALELADGSLELIPESSIVDRQPTDGPKPLDANAMIAELTEEFGAAKFRATSKRPFVVGLILAEPLSTRIEETRAQAFLREAVGFMKRVENEFENYAQAARIDIDPPRHTLVTLIFETDADFEKFAEESTGGRGLSTNRIAGFYSGLTNFLVLRMSECYDFQTPLHEAMHQQVFNRSVFQRLAPVPTWFNEGIAASFEGDGERIRNGPNRLNAHYARKAAQGVQLGWEDTVQHNAAFRGDVFAGDAYANGWSMHWFLLNHYPDEYQDYVELLGTKEALTEVAPDVQLTEFKETFGKDPSALQTEFLNKLKIAMARQRISVVERKPAGYSETQSNLGEVQLTAVRQLNGLLQVQGQLKNISPLRDMSYYVTVETGSGEYADWHVPNLTIRKSSRLSPQFVRKVIPGAPGGPSDTFRVRIRSAIANSETAATWQQGQLPTPEYRR